MNYNEEYTTPITEYNAEALIKLEEKRKLKKTANFVGVMIIIATFAFLAFNFIISLIYVIVQESITPQTFTDSADSLFLNVLTGFCNITAIGICGAIFIKKSRSENLENLPFNKISVRKLLALCAIGFTVCNLANYMTNLFLESAFSLGIDLNIEMSDYDSNSILEIIVYLISVAVVPAFSEELLFRGAVLSTLRKFGDGTAVFVSSLFFGIFHGNFIQLPFAFMVGLMLSLTVVYTNSLLPAILIHFINNSFSVICDVLYVNIERWGLNEAIVNIAIYAFVILIAIIAIVSLIKLSAKDKEFLKLNPYKGDLNKKDATKVLITSPAIIIAFLLLLGDTVLTHLSV